MHDVALAKLFVPRIVGLRAGKVVFDGVPESLDEARLTEIYGAEDWNATRHEVGKSLRGGPASDPPMARLV